MTRPIPKSAFPVLGDTGTGLQCQDAGMTLRDWFAGQALAGFAAAPSALSKWHDGTVARCAYEIADAIHIVRIHRVRHRREVYR